MEQWYLINNKVLFNTTESVLIDKDRPLLRVTLNRPIARCLQLLIKNKGKITTQEEFFEFVWRLHGANITANTYYQNISILRRSLSKMGLGDEIIKTVSRKGLMLSQASEIVAISSAELPLETCQNKSSFSSAEFRPAKINPSIAREMLLSPQAIAKHEIKNNKDILIFKIIISLTLIFILIVSDAWLVKYENKHMDQFYDYTFIEKINGCKIYSNHKFPLDGKFTLKAKDLECDSLKNIYLTYFYFSPDIFLLSCTNNNQAEPYSSCISYYYNGVLNEV